jgi:hypothetical protein
MAVKKKQAVIVREKSESRLRSENFSTSMHDSSTEAWTTSSIPCSRSCGETRNTGGGATRAGTRHIRHRPRTRKDKDDERVFDSRFFFAACWRWRREPDGYEGAIELTRGNKETEFDQNN